MKKPSKRVKDILAGLSIEEKARQLSCIVPMMLMEKGTLSQRKMDEIIPQGIGRFTQYSTGFLSGPREAAEATNMLQKHIIDRTGGIPAIIQNESAAGLVAAKATVFPVPIALASTWEPQLAHRMGETISREAKAVGIRVAMSPVADVARDSRWGRVGETFGEDPMLVSRFTAEKAKGIQGMDYRENVVSLAKHFLGYGMSEGGINCAVINMGRKDLIEIYGAPFAAAIQETDMQGVMVTYSEIDGLPMSVNEYYMNDVLRGQMGFSGLAVCDGGSIPRCHYTQGLYNSPEELAGHALRASIDADTPFTQIYNRMVDAVQHGLVDEKDLDAAVLRTLTQKEELGLLDDPYVNPDEAERIYSIPDGREASQEIANKEITLLKNEGVLPISDKVNNILLAGPFADRLSTLFGGYAYPSFIEMLSCMCLGEKTSMEGISDFFEKMLDKKEVMDALGLDESQPLEENMDNYIRRQYGISTLREALVAELPHVKINCCTGVSNCDDWQGKLQEAIELAKDSELIILALGEVTGFGKDATSGEGINNPDLRLPGYQQQLVEAIAELGKPVILILFNGRPLAISEVEPLCDAIVEAWYPGPYGGDAVAGVLSGRINPGGKLPITFPQISSQCPIYYGHKTGSGYLDINQQPIKGVMQPLFPFGYGLSYTNFELTDLDVQKNVSIGDSFTLSVRVKNTGDCAGDEVVQVYTHTRQPSVIRPIKELRAFKRVPLQSGESKTIEFKLDTRQFGYFNKEDEFVVEPCEYDIMVGNSSSDIAQQALINLVGKTLDISADKRFGFGVVFK